MQPYMDQRINNDDYITIDNEYPDDEVIGPGRSGSRQANGRN